LHTGVSLNPKTTSNFELSQTVYTHNE
jgi:hypothetical protein